MPETLATAQSTWTKSASSSVPVGSIGEIDRYTYTAIGFTAPAGCYVLALPNILSSGSGTHNTLGLSFHGSASDSTSDIRVRIWAVSELGSSATHQYGVYLGELKLILGSTDGPDSSTKMVCDIQVVDDRSLSPPAMRIIGADPAKGMAMVGFDALGSKRVILQFGTDKTGVVMYPNDRGF